MTVRELRNQCNSAIEMGFGNATVILSDDEEGNGYHMAGYPLLVGQSLIREVIDYTGSQHHVGESKNGYALLG